MDYTVKNIVELKQICTKNKIKGISGKKKAELMQMIIDNDKKNTNIETPEILSSISHTTENTTLPSYVSITEL